MGRNHSGGARFGCAAFSRGAARPRCCLDDGVLCWTPVGVKPLQVRISGEKFYPYKLGVDALAVISKEPHICLIVCARRVLFYGMVMKAALPLSPQVRVVCLCFTLVTMSLLWLLLDFCFSLLVLICLQEPVLSPLCNSSSTVGKVLEELLILYYCNVCLLPKAHLKAPHHRDAHSYLTVNAKANFWLSYFNMI